MRIARNIVHGSQRRLDNNMYVDRKGAKKICISMLYVWYADSAGRTTVDCASLWTLVNACVKEEKRKQESKMLPSEEDCQQPAKSLQMMPIFSCWLVAPCQNDASLPSTQAVHWQPSHGVCRWWAQLCEDSRLFLLNAVMKRKSGWVAWQSYQYVPAPSQRGRVWYTSYRGLVLHCQQMWTSKVGVNQQCQFIAAVACG